jgi:hypothetical protein
MWLAEQYMASSKPPEKAFPCWDCHQTADKPNTCDLLLHAAAVSFLKSLYEPQGAKEHWASCPPCWFSMEALSPDCVEAKVVEWLAVSIQLVAKAIDKGVWIIFRATAGQR